jgi:hypothetical protein
LEKAGLERQEGQMKEKPKILPHPNVPYYLLNDMKLKVIENLQNSKGETLSTIQAGHYADAEHLIINHFVTEHMELLILKRK